MGVEIECHFPRRESNGLDCDKLVISYIRTQTYVAIRFERHKHAFE